MIKKMKSGKAPGSSGVETEILKASFEFTCPILRNFANAMIAQRKTPDDWNESFIINLFKGNGDALDRQNYTGLKHCLKVIESCGYVDPGSGGY